MDCIFCKIVRGEFPCWKVYEDELHLGFLTPFPNTPGFTVLIPKEHLQSDILALDDSYYMPLLSAAKKVSALLNAKLGTKRTALIAEGMGVDHAHLKLIPLHNIPDGHWQPILSNKHDFTESYAGYLTTNDGPRMSNEQLNEIRDKILD